MDVLEPNWHLAIATGMELIREQSKLSWKESADSFCNLPTYEQQVYCRELWRIGEAKAKAIEEAERLANEPVKALSVSERVIEWHQKQLNQ